METHTVVCGIVVLMFAGMLCAPTKKGLFDFTCDEDVNCTDKIVPVCGSDGKTYDNGCELGLENQYRYCILGDFNRIVKVHDGNCSDTNP